MELKLKQNDAGTPVYFVVLEDSLLCFGKRLACFCAIQRRPLAPAQIPRPAHAFGFVELTGARVAACMASAMHEGSEE